MSDAQNLNGLCDAMKTASSLYVNSCCIFVINKNTNK